MQTAPATDFQPAVALLEKTPISARGTRQNPIGRFLQRVSAVTVLSMAIGLLFFYYLRRSWPEDIETRLFAAIGFGVTLVSGVVVLIIVSVVARRPSCGPDDKS